MEVRHADDQLDYLEREPDPKSDLDKAIVKKFKKVMNLIRAATDERDLYGGGQRFEKLQGNRSHQHSFRLNDQWRLIVEIEKGQPGNTICVIEIVDYH